MTRFARARGSKSSNEKAPEDGTPWEVMKEQLLAAKKQNEDSKNREEAEKQRLENYQNFLAEQKVLKRKATWCDFPETIKDETVSSEKKKSKYNKSNVCNNNSATTGTDLKNRDKKTKNKTVTNQSNIEVNKIEEENEGSTNNDLEQTNEKSHPLPPGKNKKKKNKRNKLEQNTNSINNTEQIKGPENNIKDLQKSKKKFDNVEPVRRKAIDDKSFKLIINGKDVELVRFDGFPIMKKDAERLQELKTSMIKKGIPKSEVQRTMKLERRRAEKALARVKRDVCYNCRKGGHNLSDCPELKSKIPGVDAGDGMCFKCGSTEHKQFECKVQRDKEFRFATCFICKEQGHIARQCPDNPKGLYPNGGSCKLCGDVTHLKKDCPTTKDTKEETSVKLQTLDSSDNIEDIGKRQTLSVPEEKSKKPKKIRF